MILRAYGGFSFAVLFSVVVLVWMLGLPPTKILPLALQLAAVLLGVAIVVDLLAKPFQRRSPRKDQSA